MTPHSLMIEQYSSIQDHNKLWHCAFVEDGSCFLQNAEKNDFKKIPSSYINYIHRLQMSID